jgi:N-methylhydantoinase B
MAYMDTLTGAGGGAQTVADGQDMYGWVATAGIRLPDVEVHEATDPVMFLWRRVAKNSGGPGHLRGGQGVDQAYLLVGSASFAGFANLACADFPPPGFGGGFPPSVSLHYPIRGTHLHEHVADGAPRPLDVTALDGTKETVAKKVPHFVFSPGDVLWSNCGGGGGLGDPLLRSPALVARDVRDGYLTIEHARAAYGVVLRGDGDVDAGATKRCRRELRSSRIGGDPAREAVPPDLPGLSIAVVGDGQGPAWTCAYCEAPIASVDEDWRHHAVRRELPIADAFAAYGMQVRRREAKPGVRLVQCYCPTCASCLSTDVLTDRWQPASPVLAATVETSELAGSTAVA